MPNSEPKCIEVGASVSVGGKVQIVKFEYDENYYLSFKRQYSIPEDWTEEDVEQFQTSKALELREQLEPLAQETVDSLQRLRDEIAAG